MLVLIIRTRSSDLPYFFHCALSVHPIFLPGKQICTLCDKKMGLYTVISPTAGSMALSDNNIIRIMSDLSIIFSPLSHLPMVTPHTGGDGLV